MFFVIRRSKQFGSNFVKTIITIGQYLVGESLFFKQNFHQLKIEKKNSLKLNIVRLH